MYSKMVDMATLLLTCCTLYDTIIGMHLQVHVPVMIYAFLFTNFMNFSKHQRQQAKHLSRNETSFVVFPLNLPAKRKR